jgi:hypothetical protein
MLLTLLCIWFSRFIFADITELYYGLSFIGFTSVILIMEWDDKYARMNWGDIVADYVGVAIGITLWVV